MHGEKSRTLFRRVCDLCHSGQKGFFFWSCNHVDRIHNPKCVPCKVINAIYNHDQHTTERHSYIAVCHAGMNAFHVCNVTYVKDHAGMKAMRATKKDLCSQSDGWNVNPPRAKEARGLTFGFASAQSLISCLLIMSESKRHRCSFACSRYVNGSSAPSQPPGWGFSSSVHLFVFFRDQMQWAMLISPKVPRSPGRTSPKTLRKRSVGQLGGQIHQHQHFGAIKTAIKSHQLWWSGYIIIMPQPLISQLKEGQQPPVG